MYTSIVEYSLIGAGVMLIVWRNIDYDRQPSTVYVRRKHQIRVNCSKSSTGLFIGLAYLAATFTLMAIFSGYIIMRQMSLAATVFAISDIGQVCCQQVEIVSSRVYKSSKIMNFCTK